jgi:hypothetical protein
MDEFMKLSNVTYYYLATVYSKHPGGLDAAFELAVQTRGLLVKQRIPVFSPIIHSHYVGIRCNIDPYDHSFWLPCEAPIMAHASGLIMLMSEGWTESVGMNAEREAFAALNKPIILMEPGVIPDELLKTVY